MDHIKSLDVSNQIGVAIDGSNKVYLWEQYSYEVGKASKLVCNFQQMTEDNWDEIILAQEDYIYIINDFMANRVLLKNMFHS